MESPRRVRLGLPSSMGFEVLENVISEGGFAAKVFYADAST